MNDQAQRPFTSAWNCANVVGLKVIGTVMPLATMMLVKLLK